VYPRSCPARREPVRRQRVRPGRRPGRDPRSTGPRHGPQPRGRRHRRQPRPDRRDALERLLIPVDTFVSTNFVGLVEAIGTGRVDIGLFGPAALVQAMDAYGAVPIVASVRQGSTTYRAQFNVRCDSGIETFEDLRGRTIAFVDPGPASGYQFPSLTR